MAKNVAVPGILTATHNVGKYRTCSIDIAISVTPADESRGTEWITELHSDDHSLTCEEYGSRGAYSRGVTGMKMFLRAQADWHVMWRP